MKSMLEQITNHNVASRVTQLRARSDNGQWTAEDTKQWETIDSIMAQARTCSENKCNKKKSGQIPWSPELKMSGETLLYWRLRIREFTSRQINQSILETLAASCKISEIDRDRLSAVAIISRIRDAKKNHKQVKIDAVEHRETYMKEEATLLATLHGMSDIAARAAIAAREKSSKQFRALRSIFKQGRSNGLERLDVPEKYAVRRQDETQPRILLVTKQEIEEVLLPHTVKRFRQHHETPFGHGERCSELGQDCSSDDFHHLRRGTYDCQLESLSKEARVWIRHLKEKKFVEEGRLISVLISTEDWISVWISK